MFLGLTITDWQNAACIAGFLAFGAGIYFYCKIRGSKKPELTGGITVVLAIVAVAAFAALFGFNLIRVEEKSLLGRALLGVVWGLLIGLVCNGWAMMIHGGEVVKHWSFQLGWIGLALCLSGLILCEGLDLSGLAHLIAWIEIVATGVFMASMWFFW